MDAFLNHDLGGELGCEHGLLENVFFKLTPKGHVKSTRVVALMQVLAIKGVVLGGDIGVERIQGGLDRGGGRGSAQERPFELRYPNFSVIMRRVVSAVQRVSISTAAPPFFI